MTKDTPIKRKPRRPAKEPPSPFTPEYWREARERARRVEAEETREADGYGLAPWEIVNDD